MVYWLEKFKEGDANKESYRKYVIDTLINAVILYEDTITIAYNYSGENDVIEVDLNKLKDSSDSVRMSLVKWWLKDSN